MRLLRDLYPTHEEDEHSDQIENLCKALEDTCAGSDAQDILAHAPFPLIYQVYLESKPVFYLFELTEFQGSPKRTAKVNTVTLKEAISSCPHLEMLDWERERDSWRVD